MRLFFLHLVDVYFLAISFAPFVNFHFFNLEGLFIVPCLIWSTSPHQPPEPRRQRVGVSFRGTQRTLYEGRPVSGGRSAGGRTGKERHRSNALRPAR